MNECLTLGSAPLDEECAQVGTTGYNVRASMECSLYKAQLLRTFVPPMGAKIMVKQYRHDVGNYYEVCVVYNDQDEKAEDFAFELESNCPSEWDSISKEYLATNAV